MNRALLRILLVASLCSATASARGADFAGDVVKRYGGVYSTDCGDPSAPRLRADAQALSVEIGNRRMTGKNVEISVAPFGNQQPPPGEEVVTLMSEVRGSHGLSFWVHRDGSGQFVQLEADKAVAAALGADVVARRFRDCDAARSQRVASDAAAEIAQAGADASAQARGKPGESRYRAAYLRAHSEPAPRRSGW